MLKTKNAWNFLRALLHGTAITYDKQITKNKEIYC